MATLAPGERARIYALGKVARGGATRGGYVSGLAFIKINGVNVGYVRDAPPVTPAPPHFGTSISSLTITDALNEIPNTCSFRVYGWVPPQGAPVVITMGSQNSGTPRFAGFALTVDQLYLAQRPVNVAADVHAVDYTWQLGFVHVTARYTGWSVTQIVLDLVARYAAVNGFTGHNVVPNLPVINEISYTEEELPTAITRACQRIGAYWYVDYLRDVHVFFEEDGNGVPRLLDPFHPTLANVQRTGDRTQALSRVFVEGRGARVLGPVLAGETAVPLDHVDMFEVASDLFAKVSFQGSEGGAQYVNFAEIVPGGGGALVGPGVTPTTKVGAALTPGAGVTLGAHDYAYTWVTAAGETAPSPPVTVTPGVLTTPTIAPTFQGVHPSYSVAQGTYHVGDRVEWTIAKSGTSSTNDLSCFTALGPISAPWTVTQGPKGPGWCSIPLIRIEVTTDPFMKYVVCFERVNGGPWYWAFQSSTTGGAGGVADSHYSTWGNTGPAPPTPNPVVAVVALSGIAVGPAAVTARKIYRSAAGTTTPLKLVATLANNTTTTYTDTAADAALGAPAPATDTSGLQQAAGTVLPGATAFPIAGTGNFRAAGGWAIIGNGEQTIRYASIVGNQLSGIPASGLGSITAAIAYNSTITSAPMLAGIPATGDRAIGSRGLAEGDELYLVVQRDNETTRAALATSAGGDGIREEWVQDRRLSATEARARGDATLAMRPLDLYTLNYTCRDLRTAAGKTIWVNLPPPTDIFGTFKAQTVTISDFRPYPTQYPTFTVQASSQKFSFDDWLRILRVVES